MKAKSLDTDIAGARAANMKAVWLHGKKSDEFEKDGGLLAGNGWRRRAYLGHMDRWLRGWRRCA